MEKILIVRLSSMGDVVLTTATVRAVRKAYPGARIDFAVAAPFAEIFKWNPRINAVFQYDKNSPYSDIIERRNAFLKENHIEKYDFAIDLQNNLRSILFIRGIAKKRVVLRKRRLTKLSMTYLKKMSEKYPKIPELYLEAAAKIGARDDGDGLEIWLESEKNARQYPPASRKATDKIKKIAVAPGAFHFTKRWPARNYVELTRILRRELNCDFALVGGKNDVEICSEIAGSLEFHTEDFSGSTSILQTAERLDKCDLLVSNDSGVLHIGAARRKPVAAIFGSTVRQLGFEPFRTPNIIIEKNMPCRPCAHIGRKKCPKGHFNCMEQISPNFAAKKILRFIEDLH